MKNRLLGKVAVLAQKKEVGMQDFPISITAFAADTRDGLGIDDPKSLTQYISGMYSGQQVNFSIICTRDAERLVQLTPPLPFRVHINYEIL